MLDFIKQIKDRDGIIQSLLKVDDNVLKFKGHHLPEKDMREFFGLTDEEIVKLNKLIKEKTIKRQMERIEEDFKGE